MSEHVRKPQSKPFEFPTSKVELHQWANSVLLLIVGFFAAATYNEIHGDHERLAGHETRITLLEDHDPKHQKSTENYSPALAPKQIYAAELPSLPNTTNP